MEPLHLTTSRQGATVIVHVSGELDIATTSVLRDHLLDILRETYHGHRKIDEVVMELSGLSFIDAAGLGALVSINDHARRNATPFLLSGISPQVKRLLLITGLARHFPIRPQPPGTYNTV
ncbi:STAS domain-containing protein [Nonomuraea sp. NEAU-A123]|uniref:STAS domain-containing protein n=1 Tax=Nonomuraea sp. NEAU-A123 TaxID=2839649 RepID=UPI001BE432FF|nr:STAS domain-containing protein [Nonomuraea sp. NEAU-A123]MBT2225456.1 STAS domain-containing protein [Nonomuraea sp. NEAU-A123]